MCYNEIIKQDSDWNYFLANLNVDSTGENYLILNVFIEKNYISTLKSTLNWVKTQNFIPMTSNFQTKHKSCKFFRYISLPAFCCKLRLFFYFQETEYTQKDIRKKKLFVWKTRDALHLYTIHNLLWICK